MQLRLTTRIRNNISSAMFALVLMTSILGCASEAENKFNRLAEVWKAAHGVRAQLNVAEMRKILGPNAKENYSDDDIKHSSNYLLWDFGKCDKIGLSDTGFLLLRMDNCK